MKHALAFCLALAAAPASADRLSLLLHSSHIGTEGDYEESTPGVFYTVERDLDWTVGVFRNSFGDWSPAATVGLPVAEWEGGQASLFAGAAYYPDAEAIRARAGNLVPLAGVQVRHGNLFAQVMPVGTRPIKGVVSVGLTFDLGE